MTVAGSTADTELKAIDAPIEVLLFDPLTRPVAVSIAPYIGPIQITLIALVARLAGAACVVGGYYIAAAALLFVGFYLDAVDGKVARIRGDQVGIHGTADFLLDQVALVVVLTTFIVSGNTDGAFDAAVLTFLGVYLVYTAIGGTRLRILGDLAIDWKAPGSLKQAYEKFGVEEPTGGLVNRAIRVYTRLQAKARAHRLLLRPTGIEAQFSILIVTPLLGMSRWPVIVAVVLLIPDFIAMGIATIRLARIEDASRAHSMQ